LRQRCIAVPARRVAEHLVVRAVLSEHEKDVRNGAVRAYDGMRSNCVPSGCTLRIRALQRNAALQRKRAQRSKFNRADVVAIAAAPVQRVWTRALTFSVEDVQR